MVNNSRPDPAPKEEPVTPERLIQMAAGNANNIVILLGRYRVEAREHVRRQLLEEAQLAADISVAYSSLAIAMLSGEQLQVLKEQKT